MTDSPEPSSTILSLTADIVAAHVSNNSVSVADVAGLIEKVHGSLAGLESTSAAVESHQEPAVSIRSSIKPDHIVCLEDGKKLKMLKRHLRTDHQMTPADYRAKWNLQADYPMAAPNYAQQRREMAHKIGLGRKPTTADSTAETAPKKAPRARPKKLGLAQPK